MRSKSCTKFFEITVESNTTSLMGTSALKEIAAFESLDPQHDEIGIRQCSGSPPEYVHAQREQQRAAQQCTSVAGLVPSQKSTSGPSNALSLGTAQRDRTTSSGRSIAGP